MKIKDKILITGINGLLGSALKIELKKKISKIYMV